MFQTLALAAARVLDPKHLPQHVSQALASAACVSDPGIGTSTCEAPCFCTSMSSKTQVSFLKGCFLHRLICGAHRPDMRTGVRTLTICGILQHATQNGYDMHSTNSYTACYNTSHNGYKIYSSQIMCVIFPHITHTAATT